MNKTKIRKKTWYWGNYVIEGENGFTIKQNDFELYDESKHGWHNSEEFKNGQDANPMNSLIERRERYAERKANKIARCEELAEKHKKKSNERAKRSIDMASCIPMGQPIHIGHHSEKSDRSFRNKIDVNMRKAIEHETIADSYANKAESLASNDNIYSDDPDAIEKLNDKINGLKKLSENMKYRNSLWRKDKNPDKSKEVPYPSWALTNLRGKIKNAEQRIESLKKVGTFESFEINEIKVDIVDGQIQVAFPYKPNEETRTKLKSSPLVLKWSNYSKKWVRKYTGQGAYYFDLIKSVLNDSKSE